MVARGGRWKPVLTAAGVAIFIGVLGGTLTDTGIWYQSLIKPSWQPPDWLFGPGLDLDLCAGNAVPPSMPGVTQSIVRSANG